MNGIQSFHAAFQQTKTACHPYATRIPSAVQSATTQVGDTPVIAAVDSSDYFNIQRKLIGLFSAPL